MKSKRKSYRRKLPKHKTRRRRGKSKITKGNRKYRETKIYRKKRDTRKNRKNQRGGAPGDAEDSVITVLQTTGDKLRACEHENVALKANVTEIGKRRDYFEKNWNLEKRERKRDRENVRERARDRERERDAFGYA